MSATTIFDEHCRRNRTTVERWETMATHRARVMGLLEVARGQVGESLCLLGAGNGNDVDLARLALVFQRIVLVDLDEGALTRAVSRLSGTEACNVEQCSGFDLTGILPVLSTWQGGQAPSDAELTATIEVARTAPAPDIGTFDVVCSTCVLTQLIDSIYLALATEHRRCLELVLAVRNRHLEMIMELLKPGGAGVLLTDFVSTETAPEIARLDEAQLPQAASKWIAGKNFFTGANPFAIRDHYCGRLPPSLTAADVRVSAPWRWDIGAKQFAVSAITFRRSR